MRGDLTVDKSPTPLRIQFKHLSTVKSPLNKPGSLHLENSYKLHKNPGLYITNFNQISPKTFTHANTSFLIQFRHLSPVKFTLNKLGIFDIFKTGTNYTKTSTLHHHLDTYPLSNLTLSLDPCIFKTPTNYTKTLDYTSPISTKYHQKLSHTQTPPF